MMRTAFLRFWGIIVVAAFVAFGCTEEDSTETKEIINPDTPFSPSNPGTQPGENECTQGTTYKCLVSFAGGIYSEVTTCKDNSASSAMVPCVSGRCDETTGKCDDVLCESSDVCKQGQGCSPRGLCMPFECEDDSQCNNKYCDNQFCVRCNAEHPCSDGMVCQKGLCIESDE